MVICVYGAGSIGCYVGGRLAATGSEVVFVGRERLARQIAGHGLTLTDWRGAALRVPAPRYETVSDPVADANLVLVTVKSAATAEAGAELAGRLKPGAVVISFQNGLHNADLLRERLPSVTVLPGMVAFNVVNQGDGRLHGATEGGLEVQRHAALAGYTAAFQRAGLPLLQHDDMTGVQAAKLLLNLNNAVNALSGLPLKAQLSRRPYRRCLAMAQREALAAYAAAGLSPAKLTPLPPSWIPSLLTMPDAVFTRVAGRMLAVDPLARSSMWEDLEAGRTTEVDYLNGEIVALARGHGTLAPVNERLVSLVRDAEGGGRRNWTGEELLTELNDAARQWPG
ncbi:2-dehydropantoate 2-reductase [Micromonospora sp. CPCC 206061]|uniref:2-dehydropantoate 2-reductase n=1 Tax=Micromonospora sp. CPCC 206061 TaxID=3122410 RepID=UPI002FF33111